LLGLAVIALLLGGCASGVHSTKIDPNRPLDPVNGVVAIQVVNNAERLSGYNANWTTVNVIRLDTIEARKEEARQKLIAKGQSVPADDKLEWYPDTYPLVADERGLKDSRIFVGTIPEGAYMVASLRSYYYDGNVTSTISMPVWNVAGRFKVDKGRFTDLGTLLFQPLLNIKTDSFWGAQHRQRAYVTRTSNSFELTPVVRQMHPQLDSVINFDRLLTWDPDPIDSFRREVAQISLDNLYGTEFFALEHQAAGVLPTRLGRVRVIDKAGEWSQIQLPTQSQILAAIDTPGQILFGGERGLLFSADSISGEWSISQPVNFSYAITWLGRYDGHFLALAQNGESYELYRFRNADSEWQLMQKLQVGNALFGATGGVFPVVYGETLRLISDGENWDYDKARQSWVKSKGSKLMRIKQLDSRILVGLMASTASLAGSQVVSFDDGTTWSLVSRKLMSADKGAVLSLPAIRHDGNLLTISRKAPKTDRVELGNNSLLREDTNKLQFVTVNSRQTENNKAWVYRGQVDRECASILPEISYERRIYLLCDNGGIVFTDDLGATWNADIVIDISSLQRTFDNLIKKVTQPGI